MSAFFDIWVGDQQPGFVRTGSGSWHRESTTSCYWQSSPSGKDFSIHSKISARNYELLVIGQLYEDIALGELIEHCIKYVESNENQFNDPAGHYILFLYDKISRHHYIFTNRFGTYHAYWKDVAGEKAISTSYWALVHNANSKVLDWKGISGFLAMGFFPEDRTYLEGVRIFNPASCYCFDEQLNLKSQKRYWDWHYTPSSSNARDYLDALNQTLTASLSTSLNEKKIALPISGGLDSRTLAGVITKSNVSAPGSIWSYSYGFTTDSIETKIARQVANSCNIPFDSYVVPNYLFDKIDTITDSVELFQYIDGTRQASMQEYLTQHSDVVVGGHWGDVWMDDMGIAAATATRQEVLLRNAFRKKIVKRGHEWLLTEVSNQFEPNAQSYLDEYFSLYMNKYKYIEDPNFRMKVFKTEQWSFRWTLASIRMYQAAVFPVLPFYDKRIGDLFMSMPSKLNQGRALQIAYIKAFHPGLAKIKWQDYNSNLYLYKLLNNRNIAYRTANRIQRAFRREKPIRRNAELFYLNTDGRRKLEVHLFNNYTLTQIVPAERIKQLLLNYYTDPSAENNYSISMLHTFSRFLEKVF